ncbi:MAG: glycosyltransferase [Bacteroidales bacterium]|nr:glycosyltransferase [Bacteroidales bacterium]
MNNKPLVSFCIFSYNQENYIQDALEGAVGQDYENLEIVVSDDCSKDGTQQKIDEFVAAYKGPHRIIVNKNQQNMGIARHVNKVLYEISHGDIVLLAAGDDKSLPNRTTMSVEFFERFPEIASLSFLSQATDENLNPKIDYEKTCFRPHTFTILTLNDYLRYNIGCFSGDSRALRRSVVDSFPPLSYAKAEDYFLYLRSLMIGSICYIREPVLLRRVHGNNVSASIPTREGNKRNFQQFKADIDWAFEKGYINETSKQKLIEKTSTITKYSVKEVWHKRFVNFCRGNRLIKNVYSKIK